MDILIASHSPLFRQGIQNLFCATDLNVIGSAADMLALHHHVREKRSSLLVIIDACLPGLVSYHRLGSLAQDKRIRVFLLTERVDEISMRRAVCHGVVGIEAKTARLDELKQALLHVHAGGCWFYGATSRKALPEQSKTNAEYSLYRLSRQEQRVLKLVLNGLRNKEIAKILFLTEHTIKTHISSILRKLEIDNRTQLVVALRHVERSLQSA